MLLAESTRLLSQAFIPSLITAEKAETVDRRVGWDVFHARNIIGGKSLFYLVHTSITYGMKEDCFFISMDDSARIGNSY